MTGRPAAETDATKGACARALSQRATSLVDTRTRKHDPFAERSAVVIALRYTRSRDPETTPGAAIRTALSNDHLVSLPRPESGRDALTVRDARRVAACHTAYRNAGEQANAEACEALLAAGLPTVLDEPGVWGP